MQEAAQLPFDRLKVVTVGNIDECMEHLCAKLTNLPIGSVLI